ncbi:histidine phosphatase superfamily [Penicillium riverlandense]|uniref:histidine phosphatase superfamily n=1 Tax=Penicillium riverlandense TaxID=1903569 RepID=UPI002549A904|nr:histidine phosphatase superfamily [Penicillium riverlandense]KAJ5820011.1 histidine phosphatase superfamily [Penicillium riverlandense]
MTNPTPYFKFSTETGYFFQDEESTDPETFDYAASNFGLITRSDGSQSDATLNPSSQWQKFCAHVDYLNEVSANGEKYKVLFLGRHGEGVHNVAERRYGTKAWDEYWSLLDGDSHGTWVDARLTELGISQAETAREAWKTQTQRGIPHPQSYYVSPLNRCLATAQITFEGLHMPHTQPFRPVIKELLRETMGEHTCDRRSSRSAIEAEYPLYRIEDGFSEEDTLWDPKVRESDEERAARLRELLEDIFATDENTFVSMTAHSGAITSILEVTGHRRFPLATGGVIPLLVKAELVTGG